MSQNTCGILPPRNDITKHASGPFPCLRPLPHLGSHVCFVEEYGIYVAWEPDWECDCDDCQSDDVNDHCVLFGDISKPWAVKMIASSKDDKDIT